MDSLHCNTKKRVQKHQLTEMKPIHGPDALPLYSGFLWCTEGIMTLEMPPLKCKVPPVIG